MPRDSLAPRHRHGPQSAAARPSWTPAHVDHRLITPNRHVPDLSQYIRDRSDPKRGEDDPIQMIAILTIPLEHRTESKETQRGAPRAPPPIRRLPPL
jgi:hypothetical protein